jgi:hypothetical protein
MMLVHCSTLSSRNCCCGVQELHGIVPQGDITSFLMSAITSPVITAVVFLEGSRDEEYESDAPSVLRS